MPNPTDPVDAEMPPTGPAGVPPPRDVATPAARPGRPMGLERLALILIALTGSLSLVSYRFHLFARTYDTFIIDQVIPASGLQGWLTRSFGYDPAAYDARWRATLGSPYLQEYFQADPLVLNTTASDYLDIWYHTREILRGRNPYADGRGIVLVSHGNYRFDWGKPKVFDPGLPDQSVGNLSYPPVGPFLVLPFYSPNYFASYALYLAAVHAFLIGLGCLLVRACPGHRLPAALLALTLFLGSYPLGLLVDRGNIEGVVVILTGLGLLAYGRGRYTVAAVLLGVAASGKVVPALFLALFLLDGRLRPLAVSVLVAAGTTLAAMLAMHEPLGVLVPQILRNMDAAGGSVTSGDFPRYWDHSFFALLKGALFSYFPGHRAGHIAGRLAPYYTLGALVATVAALVRLRRAPFVNRVLVLTALMLALPKISADYKILHLYLPFGMILAGAARRGWATRAEVAALVLLGVLFSPKAYQFGPYSFGYYLNGATLGALILLGLAARLGGPEAGAAPEGPGPAVAA